MHIRCLLLYAIGVSALCTTPIFADTVSYTVNGVFNCTNVSGSVAGCGTNTIEFGSLTGDDGIQMTYRSDSGTLDVTPFSVAPFGAFITSCIQGGTGCSSFNIPSDLSLTLYAVIQSFSAQIGIGTAVSAFAGGSADVGGSSSNLDFEWPAQGKGNAVTIGPSTFSLMPTVGSLVKYGLPPPSSGNGMTTVQGVIQTEPLIVPGSIIPEPGSWALMLTGLGLAGLARTRLSF
jgi:hypothetical protein